MKKRILALLLLVSLLGTVLSGCGDGSTEQAPENGQTNGSTDAGTQGNAITVGIAQDLDDSLDPHKAVAAGTKEVMFNVFEGLMKPTSEGDLTPAIAESYEVSPDRLTYTFTLREGVKFHNGDTVTAEDVVYSINRCAEASETGVLQVEAFSVIQSVEATDDHTVVITIAEPSNEFISYMTTAILPADYDQQDTAPVGTGPFKFVSRTAQDSIVMEKFSDYWGTPAQLDKVTFKIIENADSILMSLQSGAVDLFAHLTSTQVAQLGSDFNVVESTMNLVQAMYLNNKAAPFDNEKVRQALCYAIDKQEIIDLAFDGYGSPIGSSMYPAFGKYFDDELSNYYTRDVERAKALLAEAGYPDGFSMTITVPSNYQPHIDTAQVLVEQLKAVGITAEIQPVEWGTWLSDVYAGRQYQSTVVGVDASNMTARALLERFTSQADNNFINYENDDYDALFAQAQACYDDAEQTEIYKQMERNLTEHAANVYIQDLADLVAVRNTLDGLQTYPIYVLDLSTVHYVQ
ncbi:peptide/nickel transport system substrate-binding protein [Oscillibacter sp. PC13]|uniref:ABC transporter substrate-binding protein n=1 Tax=Oscillibacter sp. PC13 TaxID=1855299 RepID=UPI0008EA6753|nr:ABC transporter substrate-binding protein [Oscillibacter sp. PC13]SFQ17015.1 peptide/nickel transport system substrate-binding protein [Oscillibacter sp. PC13]